MERRGIRRKGGATWECVTHTCSLSSVQAAVEMKSNAAHCAPKKLGHSLAIPHL